MRVVFAQFREKCNKFKKLTVTADFHTHPKELRDLSDLFEAPIDGVAKPEKNNKGVVV